MRYLNTPRPSHLTSHICLAIFTMALSFHVAHAQDTPTRYAQTITAQDLERHLRVIAADSMEGRDTGSPGQKKAARYVVNEFQKYGLQPIYSNADGSKSYIQPYNLYRKSWGEVYLASKNDQYKMAKDFYVSGLLSTMGEEKISVVFAGYGIDDTNYNDYTNLDIQDKAVLILEGEPQKADGTYWITGNDKPSDWSKNDVSWLKKATYARSKGAKYVLIMSKSEADKFEQQIKNRTVMNQRFSRLSMKPISENTSGNPAFNISREMTLDLLGISAKKLEKAIAKITKTGKTSAKTIKPNQIAIKAERKEEIINTENVVAYIEGSDKKDEVIVISAHIDHIGISANGEINNGADDDGSGTVSLLELAEAFSKAKADGNGPRRSILFLNVTGEEKGLFGSEYYTSNPIFPLKQTVCDLNIDMIGRVDKDHEKDHNYTYIIGSDKLSSELHQISEEANSKYINFKLDYTFNSPTDPNRFYYRSDHYNFAKNKVPVVFYFTGVHEDYHRPGDDVEKILFEKQSKIVQLVFYTAWELANRNERIKVDSNKP